MLSNKTDKDNTILQKKMLAVLMLRSIIKRIEALMVIVLILFAACLMQDYNSVTNAGLDSEEFPGFEALRNRNEDIAGWIRMDGTHINHPVLHGKDNYEYLSKDADGEFYQGGSIFMDADNSADFSDRYIIIHGHHMTKGAMFSDVAEYLDREFFYEHTRGELITPAGIYSLTAVGSGLVNAYECNLYYAGPDAEIPLNYTDECTILREMHFNENDKLIMLSTCAGDMTDMRAVLFCRARYIGDNDAAIKSD